ncbi:MAG: hypothetical protein OWQ52_00625 [Metallosphaera prunae]|uniref:hypothetical protein n=1 Tax=Metallosphaera prunae TaxID=47304 RepID=UPI0022729E58|nr:hypothetical protein [Metallosphaera prunae]MCY0860919.1 hypothetical protein [Metallosphaera prunae]
MKWLIVKESDLNLHSDGQIEVEEKMAQFSKGLFITTPLGFPRSWDISLGRVKIYEIVNGITEERGVRELPR